MAETFSLAGVLVKLLVPVRRPVGMHERSRHVRLQLDDGEPKRGDGQTPRPVDGPVPFEVGGGGQAELVGEVALLVVILSVLMFVECQHVGAVLVLVDPVLALLTQFEQVV